MIEPIVNGAPMARDWGTQDLSTRRVPRDPEMLPQHLPKFYIFAQKGPLTPELVVGADRQDLYGAETFDPYSKYHNHATAFANLANEQGNACILQRVVADNAGPRANVALYMDVLPTKVDRYERNSDGSIKTDALGSPIVNGVPIDGYKVKWVAEFFNDHAGAATLGSLTQKIGDQTDPTTGVQSTRYPIVANTVADIGEGGNRYGFRMWAPTLKSVDQMPTKLMEKHKVYPYMFQCVKREADNTTPIVHRTLFDEQSIMIALKNTAVDPLTGKELAASKSLIPSYTNLTDARYALTTGLFGEVKFYQANIDELLAKFHAAEVPFVNQFSDFSSSLKPEEAGLFNFVSGQSSQGVPYESFVFVDSVDSIKLTEDIPVWAAGGSDGDVTDAEFNKLVKRELQRYADKNDELMDVAYHVESFFYDSGFPMDVKKDIAYFISRRHDTFAHLGLHEVGERTLTASEEISMAIALRTQIRMFPESEVFATPAMRAMITGRSGKLRNSLVTDRLPLTAEVLIKSAKYWGAANGKWKEGNNFDGNPGHIVENMTDINVIWVPKSVRNRNWDVGLNFTLRYDRSSHFFPAYKTVYDNDTSVLTSYANVAALCQVNKVQHAVWREFSGVDHLTPAQLADNVNASVSRRLDGRFDNRFVFIPNAHFTDLDILRGFSWTLEVKAYMNNMRTVQTHYTTAYRRSDLGA